MNEIRPEEIKSELASPDGEDVLDLDDLGATEEQRPSYKDAAAISGMDVTSWIFEVLDRAAS